MSTVTKSILLLKTWPRFRPLRDSAILLSVFCQMSCHLIKSVLSGHFGLRHDRLSCGGLLLELHRLLPTRTWCSSRQVTLSSIYKIHDCKFRHWVVQSTCPFVNVPCCQLALSYSYFLLPFYGTQHNDIQHNNK